jgi:hypothetical protein
MTLSLTLPLLFAGDLLLKRLLLAIPQALQSREDYIKFDASLRVDMPDEVNEIEKDLEAWELDKTHRDPYRVPKSSKSFSF